MENIEDNLDFLKPIIKGIAAQFGENCEVVLHDLTKGYDSTIVAIENGHVTGRKVGDPGSNLGLEVLRGTVEDGDKYNYITHTKDGNVLRSTSIYFKNNENKVIGSLCINFDISEYLAAENSLRSITMHDLGQVQEVNETFASDVSELLDSLLQSCLKEIGKPLSLMSKEDKIKGIEFLDKKGAFLVKKSGDKVCEFFDISKFTLYKILDQIRKPEK